MVKSAMTSPASPPVAPTLAGLPRRRNRTLGLPAPRGLGTAPKKIACCQHIQPFEELPLVLCPDRRRARCGSYRAGRTRGPEPHARGPERARAALGGVARVPRRAREPRDIAGRRGRDLARAGGRAAGGADL